MDSLAVKWLENRNKALDVEMKKLDVFASLHDIAKEQQDTDEPLIPFLLPDETDKK